MAWTGDLKYWCGYAGLGQTGKILIYERDYAGGNTELTTKGEALSVKYNWKGWENPIIGLTASFGIVNDADPITNLFPLLAADEGEYRIKIRRETPDNAVLFDGFLNCANNEQKYLEHQTIHFHASSYLSKLEHITPPSIEVLQTISFIDIIDDCLTQTGTDCNIRVNSSLVPVEDYLYNTKTMLNLTGVYTEVFWQSGGTSSDIIERDSALVVLEKILSVFDCYLYWYDGYWYIERYADIWNNPQRYVEYTTGVSYVPTSNGGQVQGTESAIDFVDLVKVEMSQTIGMIVGKRQIVLNIATDFILNLANPDLTNIGEWLSSEAEYPTPGLRQWIGYTDDDSSGDIDVYWEEPGFTHANITNSVIRRGWFYSDDPTPVLEYWRGMYTKFRMTVGGEDKNLTIKFKVGIEIPRYGPFQSVVPWDDVFYMFHWYLQDADDDEFIMQGVDSENAWDKDAATYENALQMVEVGGGEFDPVNRTKEIEITIPISAVDGLADGDHTFILCIGTEYKEFYGAYYYPDSKIWYGDVSIVVTADAPLNYLSGKTNTNFLEKLTLEQHFSDIPDLAIKNGVFREEEIGDIPAYYTRTQYWEDDRRTSSDLMSLAHMKLHDKFMMYNVSRQKLTSRIKTTDFYKPFTFFVDQHQPTKNFILVGYTYKPEADEADIILSEYDNEEEIILV